MSIVTTFIHQLDAIMFRKLSVPFLILLTWQSTTLSTQLITTMQYTIAVDHRRHYHHRHLPRTIDLVVVELLGLIHLAPVLESDISMTLRRAMQHCQLTDRTGPGLRSADHRGSRPASWPHAWISLCRRSPHPWSRRACRLQHQQGLRASPWQMRE